MRSAFVFGVLVFVAGTAYGAAQPTSTFVFNGSQVVSPSDCPSVTGKTGAWCNSNWPPATRGTVYLYSFTETRLVPSTYPTLTRTAYVYKPANAQSLNASAPLLVYLHGGTQSGDQMFSSTSFAQLADGRSAAIALGWYKNSASCQYAANGATMLGLGGTSSNGYVDASGAQCTPPLARFSNPSSAKPFFVVFPDGVADYSSSGGSWEDGRTPSPGQYDAPEPNDEKRDDVGFIDALIAQIKADEAAVDAGRVYVGGLSNGGIMVHRLMCDADNPGYPEIGGVAAFSAQISSMADNIYSGANGREQCPASGATPAPLALFVGYDAPTPDSNGQPFYANCNPYNPSAPRYASLAGCPYAPVSGDDTMPYGTALDTGGGSFTVNSRTLGNVIASPDDQAFWRSRLSNSGAGASTLTTTRLGYFTQVRHYAFANSPAALQIYQIDHGLHENGGTRYDYSVTARVFDFLFAFARRDGAVVQAGGSYNPATAAYGNLNGSY